MTVERKTETRRELAWTLIKFSLPLMLSGILQQLYNWADAFIVGNVVGELALAAVGSTTSMVNFYVLAITGFTLGLSILFAQKYGSRQLEDLPRLLSTFLWVLGLAFLVLAGLGMCFTRQLLQLLHTNADVLSQAEDYLRIVLAGVPFLAVYNVYSAALRGIGNSRAPFYAVLLSSLVNVALDIVFVAFLGWGVAGAAFATILSQIAMTVFLAAYTVRSYPLLRFARRGSLHREMLRQGLRFGIPPMLQSSVSSVGSLILQNFMNGFGTQTVAAITTAYRVDTVILLPVTNLSSGISTVVAQNIGARKPERARKGLGVGLAIMLAMSIGLSALVAVAGEPLIALFGLTPEASAMGGEFFRTLALFYPVFGLGMALRGYLEGTGDVMWSSAIGISALLLRIVLSYGLADWVGSPIIAYAEMASWAAMLLLFALRVLVRSRKAAAGPSQAA